VTLIFVAWFIIYGLAVAIIAAALPERIRAMNLRFIVEMSVVIMVVGCLVLLPLDKWYENKFRKLEKLPEERNQA
jgi:glucan phosphoethanolaminetransferase (alkaline phosphatase superfamily)